jgi:hypothetical protein
VFFTPEVRPALAGLPHSEETPYYEHSGDFSCSPRATDSPRSYRVSMATEKTAVERIVPILIMSISLLSDPISPCLKAEAASLRGILA